MIERRVQVEEGDRLTLTAMARDVTVVGWDEADVKIRLQEGREEDLIIEQTEAGPVVSARMPCEVYIPATLPLTIQRASANLRVTGLAASLDAEQVHGNLSLSDVNEAAMNEVHGNLRAREMQSLRVAGTIHGNAKLEVVSVADLQNVRGNLRAEGMDQLRVSHVRGNLQAKGLDGTLDAEAVGGNAGLEAIAGAATLDHVAGNLAATDLLGGAKVAKTGANLTLNGDLGTGCTYHFKVGGNAALRLAEGVGAHLTLSAGGRIASSAGLANEERTARTLNGTLGDGGAEVVVEAGGNVVLGNGGQPEFGAGLGEEILRDIDLEGIGNRVKEEVERSMSQLRVKLENVDWERIGPRIEGTIERAMEQMEREIERLAEKTTRYQDRVERAARRVSQRRAVRVEPMRWQREGSPQPEPFAVEPPSDEERLSILRMVEQGKITPEEAATLLDALG